jgi:hypothetical protein
MVEIRKCIAQGAERFLVGTFGPQEAGYLLAGMTLPALNCQVGEQGTQMIGIQAIDRSAIQRSPERTQQR